MKKFALSIIVASLCLLAVFCVSIPKPSYESSVTYIDYSSITSQTGVFLTEATSLPQSYDGLGSVSSFVQDGYVVTSIKQVNDTINDPLYGQVITKKKDKVKYGDYKIASPIEAIRVAALKAKEKGANGIIKFASSNYSRGTSILCCNWNGR
jgi:hypothetical protein